MSTTRKAILAQVAREFGWKTGNISSGSATTVVLDGYGSGDDYALVGHVIWRPDAASAADRLRTITAWDDDARTATVVTMSDTTFTSETYIVIPPNDLSLTDLETALNDVLAEIRQTAWLALPTVQDSRRYTLGRLSHVRYPDDVDGVFLRSNPNLLANSQFETWGAGSALAPTMWTLAGSGGTIARTASEGHGYYSATVTRVGADTTLTQTVGLLNGQLAGQAVSMACWARASAASRVRIGISDGLTTTYSSYHTGGGADELLTVSKTLDAAATDLQFILSVDTGNTSGEFSNAVAVEGASVPDALTSIGDENYWMTEALGRTRQSGPQVLVELSQPRARASQLVIASGIPYPSLSTDSDSTDCPDAILIHGVIDQAVSRLAKGQLRDRYEALRLRHHNQFMRLAGRVRERPAVEAPLQVTVMGA